VLTADLVRGRRRGGELQLQKLDDSARKRALTLANELIPVIASHVGRTREDWERAVSAIRVPPRDARLREGLVKLLEDRCEFEAEPAFDPPELRRELFSLAASRRRELEPGGRLDREKLISELAATHSVTAEAVEQALFADLRAAHKLRAFEPISALALLDAYDRGQAQAVLLRAVRISVDVQAGSPAAARELFRRLKFLQLLHTITETRDGHRIVIDGPLSMFDATTKYGLKLALVLPLLEASGPYSLEAEVLWGRDRTPLVFKQKGGTASRAARNAEDALPEEVLTLMQGFEKLESEWSVAPSQAILDLPGVGLCVPDLVFSRKKQKIYLEVMGYWSRDAVFRRVDLAERGLAVPILFAVSSRLRVSEEVLSDDAPAALYVYKGVMRPRAVVEKIESLAARTKRH
jgi:predicted nuclease of restriction endonuclease-like RecB superfamily